MSAKRPPRKTRKKPRPGIVPPAAIPGLAERHGLNVKQARFVAEYLIDLNSVAAASRAGYSPKTVHSQGPRLLLHAGIQAAIAEGQAKHLAAVEIDARRVLQELARLATSDVRKLFGANGGLLPIPELSDDIAAAVSSVEVVARDRDGLNVEYVHKIRLWDKNTALANLAKHLGLLVDRISVENPQDIARAVHEFQRALSSPAAMLIPPPVGAVTESK